MCKKRGVREVGKSKVREKLQGHAPQFRHTNAPETSASNLPNLWHLVYGIAMAAIAIRLLIRWVPVNSSHGQLVTAKNRMTS